MKVSEAIRECLYYPYSREHYELTEMAYRVSLMEQFIENQRFIRSINNYTGAVMYESGMYGDLVDDEILESVIMEASDNKVTLWNKIQMGMSKIIQWIKNLFFKIALRFDKSLKQAKDIIKVLNEKKIDKELWNKLNKTCLDAIDEGKKHFIPYDPQPFTLELRFLNDVEVEDQKKLTTRLAAALSDTEVKADISENVGYFKDDDTKRWYKQDFGIAPPEFIINKLYDFVKGNNTSIQNVLKDIQPENEKAKKEGLTIQVNPKAIQDYADRLSRIAAQMETIEKKMSGGSSSSDNKEDESQTESYWYDFYPEYLYEGCYDDWDSTYGDPYSEGNAVLDRAKAQANASQSKKPKGSGNSDGFENKVQALWSEWKNTIAPLKDQGKYNKYNSRLEAFKTKVKDLVNEAKASNKNNPNLGKLNDLMKNTERVDINAKASFNDDMLSELKEKASKLDQLKSKGLNVQYNDTLSDIRAKLQEIQKNGGSRNIPREIWKYIDENKYPLLNTKGSMKQSDVDLVDEIKRQIASLNSLDKAGDSKSAEYNEKLQEIRKMIKDAQSNGKRGIKEKLNGKIYQSVMNAKPKNTGNKAKGDSNIITQDMRTQLNKLVKLLSDNKWTERLQLLITGQAGNKGKVFSAQRKQLKQAIKAREELLQRYTNIQNKLKQNGKLKLNELSETERSDILNVGNILQGYQELKEKYDDKVGGSSKDEEKDETDKTSSETSSTESNDDDTSASSVDTKGLSKEYAIMKSLVGMTMNVYLSYAGYRQKVIEGVGGILNLSGDKDNSSDENEEEEAS